MSNLTGGRSFEKGLSFQLWNSIGVLESVRVEVSSLVGKVAVVTGAGRGLGRHVAIRLASLGIKVALVSRSEAERYMTAGVISNARGRTFVLPIALALPATLPSLNHDLTP